MYHMVTLPAGRALHQSALLKGHQVLGQGDAAHAHLRCQLRARHARLRGAQHPHQAAADGLFTVSVPHHTARRAGGKKAAPMPLWYAPPEATAARDVGAPCMAPRPVAKMSAHGQNAGRVSSDMCRGRAPVPRPLRRRRAPHMHTSTPRTCPQPQCRPRRRQARRSRRP